MDLILYYIRDSLSGTVYFIYTFILLILIFAIIGYMLKQKYGKLEIKLATSQTNQTQQKNGEVQEINIPEGEINNNLENNNTKIINNNVDNSSLDTQLFSQTVDANSNVATEVVNPQSNLNNIDSENESSKTQESEIKEEDKPNQYVSLFETYEPTKKVNPTPLPNQSNEVVNNPVPMPNTKEQEVPKPINEENLKLADSIPELKL